MAFDTIVCTRAQCNTCGSYAEDAEYETPIHWESIAQAIEYLTGLNDLDPDYRWRYDEDAKTLTCDRCIAKAECSAAGGHTWSEWWVNAAGTKSYRSCENGRCGAHETREIESARPL